LDEEARDGNRKARYRSVKALALGEGPRKSYLVSTAHDANSACATTFVLTSFDDADNSLPVNEIVISFLGYNYPSRAQSYSQQSPYLLVSASSFGHRKARLDQ
jgi:hypothetical protein